MVLESPAPRNEVVTIDSLQCFYTGKVLDSIPVNIVFRTDYENWKNRQSRSVQNWLQTACTKLEPNRPVCIPDTKGRLASVLVIAERENILWSLGRCPRSLPAGHYHIAHAAGSSNQDPYLLGWGMGAYRYTRYGRNEGPSCRLSIDGAQDRQQVETLLEAVTLVRDLVNTPASDMMPQHLYQHIQSFTEGLGAELSSCVGDALIQQNYPAIHAVGRASVHPPQLITWNWGRKSHPRVTLIGKGVSFDSGGLDIKSARGMRLMKKDMGGAAHAAGIASAIMKLGLPIRLQVLIPAVENAISGNAYRPGDVLTSRSGKTIEVEDTDAEGRLILCDAISRAVEDDPDLIVDFATLTGAARVALGTEVPAFFTNDTAVAQDLMAASSSVDDPVWQLPLHKPYHQLLDSDIADISNCSSSGYAGAITAALFLDEFVPDAIRWLHFDVMSWNTRERAGRPRGGEAMGLRAVVEFLQRRYA
ncbi:MAG: leucyl aminopeptidase family protein [Proteobacteria bacterium]|nr:leucyl aminopeptidase family protein [Pseudomonadota bacterium]